MQLNYEPEGKLDFGNDESDESVSEKRESSETKYIEYEPRSHREDIKQNV